ncbi:MAG: hypothetical protein RB292_01995 [Patescibacteria group bacterium]|jgi:hypothetical protein|nr:hypothetical protein [Patescibacteria group bacterium]
MSSTAPSQREKENNQGSTPQGLTRLLEELHEYDDYYNVGAIMGRIIKKSIPERFNESDESKGEELSVENLRRRNIEILDDAGLELQPVATGALTTADQEGIPEKKRGSTMRLNLQDGKKFVSYLGRLNPDMMNDNDRGTLEEMANILTVQLKGQYNLESADDRLLELMGNLDEIIQEYKRLGAGDCVVDLEKILEKAREGALREYMMAEKLNLHKPFRKEGFILNWQQDITPGGLEEKWNNVLDTLHQINQNPKAKDIYAQAVSTAKEAVSNAIAEVLAWKKDYYLSTSNEVYLGILRAVENKLSEF